MQWIKCSELLPSSFEGEISNNYLVIVTYIRPSDGLSFYSIRFAKWEKKMHRKQKMNESKFDVLRESNKSGWRVCNHKSKNVVAWMEIPNVPEDL